MDISNFLNSLANGLTDRKSTPIPADSSVGTPAQTDPNVMSLLGVPQINPSGVTPQTPQGTSPLMAPTANPSDAAPAMPDVAPANLPQNPVAPSSDKSPRSKASALPSEKPQALDDSDIVDLNSLKDTTPAASDFKNPVAQYGQQPQVGDLLAKLTAAQGQKNDFLNNLLYLQGGSDIGRGLAGVKANDNQIIKDLSPMANQKVNDVLEQAKLGQEQQQAKIQLNDEARRQAAEQRTETSYPTLLQQEQKNLQKQNIDLQAAVAQQQDLKSQRDPDSDISKAGRLILGQMSDASGVKINVPPNMSYEMMQKLYPSITKFIDAKMMADSRSDLASMRQEAQKDKQDQKTTDKYDKELNNTGQLMEQMRGSPAVSQAEKDLYAASKADTLANLYGDPNKLSMPQVRMLSQEIAKIAAGGNSTMSELEGITPHSLAGRMSSFVSNLINKPTAANAAAFVKQFQDYSKNLTSDAQNVITDRYSRILEPRKNQLRPEDYQNLQDKYVNRFKNQQASTPKLNVDQDALAAEMKRRGIQ